MSPLRRFVQAFAALDEQLLGGNKTPDKELSDYTDAGLELGNGHFERALIQGTIRILLCHRRLKIPESKVESYVLLGNKVNDLIVNERHLDRHNEMVLTLKEFASLDQDEFDKQVMLFKLSH